MGGNPLSQRGRMFGPLEILVCNKQRGKKQCLLLCLTLNSTARAVVAPAGYKQAHTATGREARANKTDKGKETRLCISMWRMIPKHHFPGHELKYTMILICKPVKTAAEFETCQAEGQLSWFLRKLMVHLYSWCVSPDTWSYWNNLMAHNSCPRNKQLKIWLFQCHFSRAQHSQKKQVTNLGTWSSVEGPEKLSSLMLPSEAAVQQWHVQDLS